MPSCQHRTARPVDGVRWLGERAMEEGEHVPKPDQKSILDIVDMRG